jgi:RNA polymerase sigma-70 factor, ECF subfamily
MAERSDSHVQLVVADASGPVEIDDLFRDHAAYVAAIGLRLLGRRDEVDDLVQDVFLAAHRARGKLRVRHEAKRWLVVVAVRTARRRLRMRRLRGWLHLDDHASDALVGPGASPEDAAFLAQVYAQLDRMPVNHRLAWTLRHVQGEELGTVAELMGCSLATVKRWIAAAHAELNAEVTP